MIWRTQLGWAFDRPAARADNRPQGTSKVGKGFQKKKVKPAQVR